MPEQGGKPDGKKRWIKILAIAGAAIAGTAIVTVAIVLGAKNGKKDTGASKPRSKKGKKGQEKYDLILSSGFLAFAEHAGFLEAVEQTGLKVSGVMGTSAGALTGSLYCAGYTPKEVAEEFCRDPPYTVLRPGFPGGIMSFEGLIERLRTKLPPRFEDLKTEFAVGVVDRHGKHHIIDSGPLPEAVAASAAIPLLFRGVDIPGREDCNPFKDGGVVDRIGVNIWRDRRRAQLAAKGKKGEEPPPALVHVIKRSSPFSGFDNTDATGERNIAVFHSPKSGVNLLSLGDYKTTFDAELVKDRMQMEQLKIGSKH